MLKRKFLYKRYISVELTIYLTKMRNNENINIWRFKCMGDNDCIGKRIED